MLNCYNMLYQPYSLSNTTNLATTTIYAAMREIGDRAVDGVRKLGKRHAKGRKKKRLSIKVECEATGSLL